MKIYYNPRLKQFSRNLRNHSTLSEVLLWKQLRARQMMGYQFLRQKPIGNFIVDFFCPKLKLVIEVDGSSHDHPDAQLRDLRKDTYLKSIGLHILRIDDLNVKRDIDQVLEDLRTWISQYEQANN